MSHLRTARVVGLPRKGEPTPPAPTRCMKSGCDQYVNGGYCAAHRFERFRDEDGWLS